jgi:hypothetical protein
MPKAQAAAAAQLPTPPIELLQSAYERQQQETHYWIEFHQIEDDSVDTVHIGAAGVSYNIRKGQRVPLPRSAINALNLAVQELHEPVIINEKRYIRHTKRPRFPYTIDGTCTPEEARAWKLEQSRQGAGLELVVDNTGLQLRDIDQEEADSEGATLQRLPG